MTRESSQVLHSGPSNLLELPGLRTLQSSGFRTLVAGTLAAVGVGVLAIVLARLASDPAGQYAIDFTDYHRAAQRLAAGETPYAPEMLQGPVDAQGLDRYRYPPPLAQALVSTAGIPLASAALVWLIAQAVAVAAAMWLALRAGLNRAPSLEAILWAAVAAAFYLPVFDTLWKGNVSGFLALLVMLAALGARVAGIGVAGAVPLKVVPVALLPGLVGRGRAAWLAALVTGVSVTAISVTLAPYAWRDYLVVLPNLLQGAADYPTNLAPAAVLAQAGAGGSVVTGVRVFTIAVALLCALAAWAVARRAHGEAAVVTLGTAAMLLLPEAIWYHYFAVLLPLATLAWFRAERPTRALLLAGGVLTSLALVLLPLATLGGALLVLGSMKAFLVDSPDPRPRFAPPVVP